MWSFAWLLLQGATSASGAAQPPAPSAYRVLEAEHARAADLSTLTAAIQRGDTVVQRLAARALGRTEREAFASHLVPLLRSPAASVRREAVLAGAQMKVAGWGLDLVNGPSPDADPQVRATVYASLGRTAPALAEWEGKIAAGLRDGALEVRRGAARGLEALYRRHRRALVPTDSVLTLLESLVDARSDRDLALLGAMARHAALLAQRPGGAGPSQTWLSALRGHPDPQVRRIATLMRADTTSLRDSSALVRMELARPNVPLSGEQLQALLADRDEHVRLLAIDRLARSGDRGFSMLRPLVQPTRDWRTRAHAVMALAQLQPDSARPFVQQLARDTVWQARAWAARVAVVVRDSATLRRLARDRHPNVRLESLTTLDEAMAALQVDHAGLVLAAAEFLAKYKGEPSLGAPQVEAAARAFERLGRTQPVTWRDPRAALLSFISTWVDRVPSVGGRWMAQWLRDPDPEIQRIASAALPSLGTATSSSAAGSTIVPPPYVPPPFALESELAGLRGATAEIRIRGKGTMLLDLHEDVAPMTVVTFARVVASGGYLGRTLHRVVPNFVVQGGSPGADEYDPATNFFMRDEVGASNLRGTLGISTRGRDTGDGQFYFNLVDNVRLDFDYTVFATITRGLDVMDRIQEGDIIDAIVIRRADARGAR